MNYFLELIVCQELARQDNWPHCKELLCTTRERNVNLLCLPDGISAVVAQEQPLCQPITITIAMAKWEFLCLKTKQSYS